MLRFRVQIKVLWAGTEKHKRLDSLLPFTCEKPAYRILYLITFKLDGEHQVLVLHTYVLPHLVLFKLSLASTESKKRPFCLNVPTFLHLSLAPHVSCLLQALLTHI
jgi:hypothetical protein